MPKKNSYGVEDIQIGYDPRQGNIVDPIKPDQEFIIDYTLDASGNYLVDPITRQYVTYKVPIKYEDNIPFNATMQIELPDSLRKTTRILLTDIATMREYYTSSKWFREIWDSSTIIKGQVSGRWAFVRNSYRNNIFLLP